MNIKKALFYMLAFILGGCLPSISLHPFYNETDIIYEEKLLGTWIDEPNNPESIWQFSPGEDPNTYKLIFTDSDGDQGSFVAKLVKLEDSLFLDIYPSELPSEPNENETDQFLWAYNSFFLIPVHAILRVDSIDSKLQMHMAMSDEFEELLTENPDAVAHTFIEDRLLLTANTAQLQEFLLKYKDDERLFSEEYNLEHIE